MSLKTKKIGKYENNDILNIVFTDLDIDASPSTEADCLGSKRNIDGEKSA